jgi:predicted RNase H-like HicB family nuclease
MRDAYPVTVEEDNGGYTVFFDGLPGATWAKTAEEAIANAKDLLTTALEMLLEDGETPPPPPPPAGRMIIEADIHSRRA